MVQLIISVSIFKKVCTINSLYGFMYIFTLSVPPISPNVSVIPVINGRLLLMNISVDVSTMHIDIHIVMFLIANSYTWFSCWL